MQAMRQLGNCTKSTHGAMGEVVARTFLRIVNGSRNPMNFSTRAGMTEIMTADEAGWRNLRRSASIVSENSRNATSP
jgi:hypothetical protein